jgi:hypothetical protein
MQPFGRLLLTVVAASAALTAHGGVMRYDLPELLGDHQLATLDYGFSSGGFVTTATIQTPYDVYQVNSARLVIVSSSTAGTVRGDGVDRAADEVAFLPRVTAQPKFYSGRNIGFFSMDPPPSVINLDQSYTDPFRPDVTPLPGPGTDWILSAKFDVTLALYPDSIALASIPNYIPLDPFNPRRQVAGLTIVTPAVAHITEAYIIFEGYDIVPEPTGGALAVIAFAALLAKRRKLPAASEPNDCLI